jgi:hypothetical protein
VRRLDKRRASGGHGLMTDAIKTRRFTPGGSLVGALGAILVLVSALAQAMFWAGMPRKLLQVILLIYERDGSTFRRLPWRLRPIHQP